MLKKLIISAPFGNYFQFPNATSTLGTYTRYHRGGLLKRLYKVLTTVRYYRRSQSWINRLGLPCPSIDSIKYDAYISKLNGHTVEDKILSIMGFNKDEWVYLVNNNNYKYNEFDLGCPNVKHKVSIKEIEVAAYVARIVGKTVIAKIPPIKWLEWGKALVSIGVNHFHLCNTISSPGGGYSGKILKQYSLCAIEDYRKEFNSEITIIGGGGITCNDDVKDYYLAGADHVAIASMLFNPFNWKKIRTLI